MSSQDSSSYKRIGMEEIGDSGMIFLRTSDPLDHVITAITKQEFSNVGFYYLSRRVHYAILVTPFGDSWFRRIPIHQLVSDPTTLALAVKPLLSAKDSFSMSLCQLLTIQGRVSLPAFLRQLVGLTEINPVPCCGTELVNRVISGMDKSHMFSDNNTVSSRLLDSLDLPFHGQPEDRGRLLAYLASNLSQAVGTKQIQSYLVPDGLFGELRSIELGERTPESVPSGNLTKLVDVFIRMLWEDEEFYQTVCRGVTEGRKHASALTRTLTSALSELSQSRVDTLQYIISCLTAGQIHMSHLRALAEDANQDADRVSKFTKQTGSRVSVPTLDRTTKVTLRVDTVSKTTGPSLQHTVKEIHQLVSEMVDGTRESGQGLLQINRLIELTNELTDISAVNTSRIPSFPDNSSYSIIAKTADNAPEPQLRLLLDSGKEVALSFYGADLSLFTREELLEILEVLDNSEHDHLDSLRMSITEKLAEV